MAYENPAARAWRTERPHGVRAFHASLPGYAVTRLVEVPQLAAELGVARLFVKEECERMGLPAFKILGASYAVARALSALLGADHVLTLDELRTRRPEVELIAATDGNHGRAVAHIAALLGLPARVFTPRAISDAAKRAIEGEGATRIELDAPYDDVVAAARAAADAAGENAMIVQDTAWPGYAQIPEWIADGYSTLFEEVDEQLAAAGVAAPDVVAVGVGVGALAQAAVVHYRSGGDAAGAVGAAISTDRTTGMGASVVSVEPTAAPAFAESLPAGRPLTVATGETIMAGLNCGTPSPIAWPVMLAGLDRAVVVDDEAAARAVRDLESAGVDSGPSGASTLAGVRVLAASGSLQPTDVVVLISTEGRAANPLPG